MPQTALPDQFLRGLSHGAPRTDASGPTVLAVGCFDCNGLPRGLIALVRVRSQESALVNAVGLDLRILARALDGEISCEKCFAPVPDTPSRTAALACASRPTAEDGFVCTRLHPTIRSRARITFAPSSA